MEEVDCGECGYRYDSQRDAFCPRCGNMAKQPRPSYRPDRFDPRRRRAQIGGIILAVLGGFALLNAAWAIIAPAELDDDQLRAFSELDLLADQPGGGLHIRWMQNGTPLEGVAVFTRTDGTEMANVTLVGGWSNLTVATAYGNATLDNTTIAFYAPAGETVVGVVDMDGPPAWVAAKEIPATRIIAGFLAFFAAFVAVGGVLAIRLKAWGLSLAAAIIAVVPAVMMAVVVPLVGLVLGLPTALALVFIIQGRSHFS